MSQSRSTAVHTAKAAGSYLLSAQTRSELQSKSRNVATQEQDIEVGSPTLKPERFFTGCE